MGRLGWSPSRTINSGQPPWGLTRLQSQVLQIQANLEVHTVDQDFVRNSLLDFRDHLFNCGILSVFDAPFADLILNFGERNHPGLLPFNHSNDV